jgi:hypothetical protein
MSERCPSGLVVFQHNICELIVRVPFVCFRCRFDFIQVWRVIFVQHEDQSINQSNIFGIFPRVRFVSSDLRFLFMYIKYILFSKKNILELTVIPSFVWITYRFDLKLVWRVFLAHYDNQSPIPNIMSWRFSHGVVVFRTDCSVCIWSIYIFENWTNRKQPFIWLHCGFVFYLFGRSSLHNICTDSLS